MKRILTLLLALLLIPIAVKAQGSGETRGDDKPETLATKAAESWMKLWDAGKYKESYEKAAQDTRAVYTQRNWYVFWYASRRPLGDVKSRKQILAEHQKSLPSKPDQEAVILIYEGKFENEESIRETFVVFLEKDGTWRVWLYVNNLPLPSSR